MNFHPQTPVAHIHPVNITYDINMIGAAENVIVETKCTRRRERHNCTIDLFYFIVHRAPCSNVICRFVWHNLLLPIT